jgi:hypothetical protein
VPRSWWWSFWTPALVFSNAISATHVIFPCIETFFFDWLSVCVCVRLLGTPCVIKFPINNVPRYTWSSDYDVNYTAGWENTKCFCLQFVNT